MNTEERKQETQRDCVRRSVCGRPVARVKIVMIEICGDGGEATLTVVMMPGEMRKEKKNGKQISVWIS